jgi:hypothetical protein
MKTTTVDDRETTLGKYNYMQKFQYHNLQPVRADLCRRTVTIISRSTMTICGSQARWFRVNSLQGFHCSRRAEALVCFAPIAMTG